MTLASLVPESARSVLLANCGVGDDARALSRPGRRIIGIDPSARSIALASSKLSAAWVVDLDRDDVPLDPRSVDCVVVASGCERWVNVVPPLRRLERLLRPCGCLLIRTPSEQHHATLAAMLRGDSRSIGASAYARNHFTFGVAVKAILDAGLIPSPKPLQVGPVSEAFLEASRPLLQHLGVDEAWAHRYLGSEHFDFEARPSGWFDTDVRPKEEEPLTFVACVNDDALLRDNLLASPCLGPASPHQIVCVRRAQSAAHGLSVGLARAVNPIVVLLHQDVYLPEGWPTRFVREWRKAEATLGKVMVAGVYGVRRGGPRTPPRAFGHVIDRRTLLRHVDGGSPSEVDTLDEVLLATRRDTPMVLEPRVGFHLYGSDVALAAREAGFKAVALDAPCFHNSLLGSTLPAAFHASAAVLAEKWRSTLPIQTSCGLVTATGVLDVFPS